MQKHQLYINLLTLTFALAFSACVEEVVYVVNPDVPEVGEKTPIELSIGGVEGEVSASTRAVITNGTTNDVFGADTKVFILMQSDKDEATHEGYEYKGSRANTLYSVCRGDVVNNTSSTNIVFDDINKKYWDDAHARSSQLTIWAFAQRIAQGSVDGTWKTCYFQSYDGENPSMDYTKKLPFNTGTTTYNFRAADAQNPAIYPAIYEFNVCNPEKTQTSNTLIYQDILFSNNIANYVGNTKVPEASRTDNRLKFDFNTKKFPASTELKFYHAMSKITIQIKAGNGFKADGTDFELGNNKSVDKLSGFNTKGLFNIKDGEFQKIHEVSEITTVPLTNEQQTTTAPYYTLEALTIPNIHQFMSGHSSFDKGSRFVKDDTNIMIQFTIDGNTYKISSGALYTALSGLSEGDGQNQIKKAVYESNNYIPMEAGKNYVFTFVVGKQTISNISAKLCDWVNVTAAEQTPTNSYVSVSVKTNEGEQVKGEPTFDFYRAVGPEYTGTDYDNYADYSWEKGYVKASSLQETSTNSGIYKTEWYWPDNKTFYHFRSVSPTSESIVDNDATTYVLMSGGVIKSGYETAKDYIWGAPFVTSSPTPDGYSFTSGFCNNEDKAQGQLYKAIGSTIDNITLIQHHMTSQVFVDLETETGDAAVDLTGATVQLFNIATSAKLYLGNGLVTGYGDIGTINMTADAHAAASPIPAYDFSYGVLPQSLTDIGIKIATSDGNVYIIENLSTIKERGKTTAVDAWLPGKKYYYKFVLKKKAVEEISATIVNWEIVSTEEEEVQIQ